MLNRFSVNALLKSIIAIMAATIVVMLSLSAWDSWARLNTAHQIAAVIDTSAHIFTAHHNLRLDRSVTVREFRSERQYPTLPQQIRAVREAEIPALQATIASLRDIAFPEQVAFVSSLEQSMKKLTALQEETARALARPHSERRASLADEFAKEAGALIDTLENLSTRLIRLIALKDPFVDQLITIKQLAWTARNVGGDAAILLSNSVNGQPLPADALVTHTTQLGQMETAWSALEEIAARLPLPEKFARAMKSAKEGFLAPDHLARRVTMLKTLLAGEKVAVQPQQWTASSIADLATMLAVAETALEVARDHAAEQHSRAIWSLSSELGLLLAAIGLAVVLMLMLSRRVTSPLRTLQEAMLKLAGGDLSAQVSFGARQDEIGALGQAMQTFRDSMIETERLRREQKEAEAHAAEERIAAAAREQEQRQATMEREDAARKAVMRKLADDFEAAVGRIIETVSTAANELESSARILSKNAETTQQLAGVVASASEEASGNVQTVAVATEELTGSVGEIARQVQESSRIAGEAVTQAQKTDARITELSRAASRIGDVVKLITAIAEQTNLLALNATIEAARAGEAGKGFAVVAQEVKALAAQTAKATDEISSQIAGMQGATQDSVAAIKEIGGTIGRISQIASTIAAAVEEQGASTQEIARNVAQAARGTAQVATNITDVNRGASETGSASSQVLSSAQSLSRESDQLKGELAKFLNTVRAA